MEPIVYGDGLHDDAPGIQALLDARGGEVYLPAPKSCYLLGETLRIHRNQRLRLDPMTVIRLADGASRIMLVNDPDDGDENIEISGGVWDFNNRHQAPNPWLERVHEQDGPIDTSPEGTLKKWIESLYAPGAYLGVAMRFHHIKNFVLRDLTLKDPVTFGAQMAAIEHFTIENIRFDYNLGNRWPINMDGVHVEGGCRFGHIANLRGRCYDDLLALNADDGFPAPIEDIRVDGIYADDCHSAVRIQAERVPVRRVTISNVFGTYFRYCIGLTVADKGGLFENIVLRDIFAAKSKGIDVYWKRNTYPYPLIWVERGARVTNLVCDGLFRREESVPADFVRVDKDAEVDFLSITNIAQENRTDAPIPLVRIQGKVAQLRIENARPGNDEIMRVEAGGRVG